MELVDVADSKSAGGDTVWVRVPPPAPTCVDKKDAGKNPALRCGIFAPKSAVSQEKRNFQEILEKSGRVK